MHMGEPNNAAANQRHWIPALASTGETVEVSVPALRPGTRVRLPDGTIAYASPDRRVGYTWDGTYRTLQGDRVDIGWRREQLIVEPVRAVQVVDSRFDSSEVAS